MSKEQEILDAVTAALGFTPETGLRLSYDPEGPFRIDVTPSRLDVVYAAIDPMPPADYWGDERGTFRRFRSVDAREKHIRRLIKSGAVVFDVVEAPDGRLQPVNVGSRPSMVAVLALPDAVAEGVRDGQVDEQAALAVAADLLDGFSAWLRGESLGVATDSFSVNTEMRDLDYLDHSAIWGALGVEAVTRLINNPIEDQSATPAFR